MEAFAQYGLAGLAIGAVVAAIRFAEHVYDKRSNNGNGKIECPNKIHDLAAVLRSLDSTVRRTERSSRAAEQGVNKLLDDHMETLVGLQQRSTAALESLLALQAGSQKDGHGEH